MSLAAYKSKLVAPPEYTDPVHSGDVTQAPGALGPYRSAIVRPPGIGAEPVEPPEPSYVCEHVFHVDFTQGLPVRDLAGSGAELICNRDNVQRDRDGNTVPVNTPVLDSEYGLKTNGPYTYDDGGGPVSVGANYSYDDAGVQKGPYFDMGVNGELMPDLYNVLTGPQGIISGVWRPEFGVTDYSGYSNIISLNSGGSDYYRTLHVKSGGRTYFNTGGYGNGDQWVYPGIKININYMWRLVFGTHPVESVPKAQLQFNKLDENGDVISSFNSNPIPYPGNWGPGRYFSFGFNAISPQYHKYITVSDVVTESDWRTP